MINKKKEMDKKEMKMEAQKQVKMNKKDSKLGRKGLEVGKGFRTRFWEGLLGGFGWLFGAGNKKSSKKSSKSLSSEKSAERISEISGIGIGSGLCRTRSWEGGFSNFLSIIIFIISILLVSLLSLSSVSSQANESNESYGINGINETNLSNGINESSLETELLQSELNNLTSELSSQGYEWLVGYNINYPQVNVYRENSNLLLAEFKDILGGRSFNKYQIFLTGLRDVERINYDVLQKKIRIDEIRKELNPEGGNV